MTTPALYRYFSSREHLITTLVQIAYASLNEALEKSRDEFPPADHAGRFRAMCLAYHAWAIQHPQQYSLIFSTPVPGYTMDAAAGQEADRSFMILLDVIDAAEKAGRLNSPFEKAPLTPGLKAQFAAVAARGKGYSEKVIYLAIISWSFIHGITSLELNQHYALILADKANEFIQLELERLIQSIGLK